VHERDSVKAGDIVRALDETVVRPEPFAIVVNADGLWHRGRGFKPNSAVLHKINCRSNCSSRPAIPTVRDVMASAPQKKKKNKKKTKKQLFRGPCQRTQPDRRRKFARARHPASTRNLGSHGPRISKDKR